MSATLRSAKARGRAATGDGANAEPHAVESTLRHHDFRPPVLTAVPAFPVPRPAAPQGGNRRSIRAVRPLPPSNRSIRPMRFGSAVRTVHPPDPGFSPATLRQLPGAPAGCIRDRAPREGGSPRPSTSAPFVERTVHRSTRNARPLRAGRSPRNDGSPLEGFRSWASPGPGSPAGQPETGTTPSGPRVRRPGDGSPTRSPRSADSRPQVSRRRTPRGDAPRGAPPRSAGRAASS